jgi:hypothetical protein
MKALTMRFRGNEYASRDASENRKLKVSRCSLSNRQRVKLRGWLTELKTVKGQSRIEISSVESEEDAPQQRQK